MVNVLARSTIFDALAILNADEKPVFGAMTPQHMVEHLAFALRFSNGKDPQKVYYQVEKAERFKQFVCYTDHELPIGFKSPVLPDNELPPLQYANLSEAIDKLEIELSDFDTYFLLNPLAKLTNPTMGELDYNEWVTFHNKHFTHHFKQFNLIRKPDKTT